MTMGRKHGYSYILNKMQLWKLMRTSSLKGHDTSNNISYLFTYLNKQKKKKVQEQKNSSPHCKLYTNANIICKE